MKQLKSFKTLLLNTLFCALLVGLLLFAGCAKIDLYEKVVPVPDQAWQSSFQAFFFFSDYRYHYSLPTVPDPSAQQPVWLQQYLVERAPQKSRWQSIDRSLRAATGHQR